MNAKPGITVIVLGGGCAGLAAATRCAENGFAVTLVEARAHLGGRTYSFTDRKTGESLDNGFHLFMGCYHETRKFLTRVGSWEHVRFEPRLVVPYVDVEKGAFQLACPAWPAPLHLVMGLLKCPSASWKDRFAATKIRKAILSRSLDYGNKREDISVKQWLDEAGQTPFLRRALWDVITIGALNIPTERASANLLATILGRMFFGSHADSLFGMADAGLSELIAHPAQRYLESRGADVLLNSAVESLILEEGRCRGIRLRSGDELRADAVISAIPHRECAKLLPQFSGNADALGISPILSVYFWYDRPVMRTRSTEKVPDKHDSVYNFYDKPAEAERFTCTLGTHIHWVFNRNAILKTPQNGQSQSLSLVISGDNELAEMDNEDVARLCEEEMQRLYPETRQAILLDWRIIKEKSATIRPTPGFEANRPQPADGPPGLILAGDWTRTGLPSTIEGAVQSGHAAADMVSAS